DGDDVTQANPDVLRRRIGYVIQQIGLFPHMTIGENIATVPKLLGWSASKIDQRINELLDLVGMDPAVYRDRYPKQLSGGQQQRVGVARALGADPDILLMDEPFGAIDPITRDRLQNEFLRLQAQMQKTIVFVTHDINEAIKLGDRIAILGEQSRVEQYDTPERILTNPANEFVSSFIGRGASLKRLGLTHVSDIHLRSWPTVAANTPPQEALEQLRGVPESALLVLNTNSHPVNWVSADDLKTAGSRKLTDVGQPISPPISPRATLSDALNELITARHAVALVVDDEGSYLGVVDIEQINESIHDLREAAITEARAGLNP
ncbi:MAG TPA: ATP-binding cassette domain-containing protein, partial [Beutenbergiaceae bacterium]|nr:ATP-binding cassette domain-containing protein [Beutenbergiaceae bacterium]